MRCHHTLLIPALILAAVPLPADEVTKWNALAGQLTLQSDLANLNPHFHSRLMAMTHVAVHDALNSINQRYRCYSSCSPVTGTASPEAAVATAAYTVLLDQISQMAPFGFPPQQAELSAAYAQSLAAIPGSPAKTLGIQVGQSAAAQILSLRAADGIYLLPVVDANYPQGAKPGEYRYTAPFTFAFGTKYGQVPTFVLNSSDQFKPNAPYAINSKRYTEDFNEVKALGGDGVGTPSARTADQTQIALFWLESSVIGWNRIARTASEAEHLDPWENARLFALVNLALTDGYIASWQAKYVHNFWRPVTAIREAATDGNNDTAGDPAWNSLATTPPIPDHDSGHSVAGGTAGEVLERFFEGRFFKFKTCSTTLPAGSTCNDPTPAYRSYSSFAEAILENGLSRIYVGYHFRRAVTEGIEHGRRIGQRTIQKHLRPVN